MTTEEKDGAVGDEYLDPGKNPMIKLEPDAGADEKDDVVEPYCAPFIDMGPGDDEVAAAVAVFLGTGDESIEILVAPGLPLSRFGGQFELNGKPLDAASIAERRALTDAYAARQNDAAEALTAEDAMNPATNPFIRPVPLDD